MTAAREELLALVSELRRANPGVNLQAHDVVDAARNAKRYPALHASFEWNDTKAAEQWRLAQAHQLIIRCRITIEEGASVGLSMSKPFRAFGHIRDERGYRPIQEVLSTDDLFAKFLRQLETDMERIKQRVSDMRGLKPDEVESLGTQLTALDATVAELVAKHLASQREAPPSRPARR